MSDSENEDTNDIEKKYFNHIDELNKIDTVEYCLIKRAIEKYSYQTKYYMGEGAYCKNDWCKHLFEFCNDILDIKKMNKRYVCGKERLDAIDFRIIRNYQIKMIDDEEKRRNPFYQSINKYLIK